MPVGNEARSLAVTKRLWDSTSAIMQSAELEISYSPDDDEESRSLGDEGNLKEILFIIL